MCWRSTICKLLRITPLVESRSERDLRRIIDSSPIGICTVDKSGKFLTTNKAYEQMLGYDKKELQGLTFYDITHPAYRPENRKRWLEMFRLRPFKFHIDKVYVRRDGQAIDVSVHATVIKTRKGKFLGTAFVVDTTEEHRVMDALVVSEARYKTISRQLSDAQEMAQIGSWVQDVHTGKLMWSEETYRIFEININYYGDLFEAFLDTVHPDDRELVTSAYQNSLITKQPYTLEHRLLIDGKIKNVIECCRTDYSPIDGHPVTSYGTVQDITERYRLMQGRCDKDNCPNRVQNENIDVNS